GAALRGVAADMRAGQAEILAQQLDEQGPSLHLRPSRRAVHGYRYARHEAPPSPAACGLPTGNLVSRRPLKPFIVSWKRRTALAHFWIALSSREPVPTLLERATGWSPPGRR